MSGFDRVARVYDLLSMLVFGPSLRKAQVAHFSSLGQGKRIVIVGGGTGWLLEKVLLELAPSSVLYLEYSGEMLRRSRRRVQKKMPQALEIVEFQQADILKWEGGDPADILMSPFLLDVFPEESFPVAFKNLEALLKPGGTWVFSDFTFPESGLGRWYARFLIPLMYFFFRVTTNLPARKLPDFDAGFIESGWKLKEKKRFFLKMVRAEIWTRA